MALIKANYGEYDRAAIDIPMKLRPLTVTPIYIPDEDDKEPWTGTIRPPEIGRESWDFELIRLRSGGDPYDTTPFTNSVAVLALLDHQRVCTLISPLVTRVDPGSIGIGFPTQRTVIKGQCQALLTDLDIVDLSKEEFTELSFDAESFGAWYGGRSFSSDFDVSSQTFSVDIKKTIETDIDIDGLGKLTVTSGAQLSPAGQSAIIRSVAVTRLVFSAPRALEDVQLLAYSLERLFGFLIGFRGPYPAFNVFREASVVENAPASPRRGKLEIAPGAWTRGEMPVALQCLHWRGAANADLETILRRFVVNRDDLLTRMHAVEFSRFFTNDLTSRMSVVMPVLEAYLKQRYTKPDEEKYLESKEAFFKWVDGSDDPNVKGFSQKHIKVVAEKAPALKTLLNRAIDFVNSKGFNIPDEIAKRLASSRARVFHSSMDADAGGVKALSDDLQAATFLLLLHTFDDLGVDITWLTHQIGPLQQFRQFMMIPEPRALQSAPAS